MGSCEARQDVLIQGHPSQHPKVIEGLILLPIRLIDLKVPFGIRCLHLPIQAPLEIEVEFKVVQVTLPKNGSIHVHQSISIPESSLILDSMRLNSVYMSSRVTCRSAYF